LSYCFAQGRPAHFFLLLATSSSQPPDHNESADTTCQHGEQAASESEPASGVRAKEQLADDGNGNKAKQRTDTRERRRNPQGSTLSLHVKQRIV
jgi:hypothetical protein